MAFDQVFQGVPAARISGTRQLIGMAGATTFVSYEMRKHGSRLWWLPPAIGIAGHAVGIGSGVRYFEWRFVLP